MIKKFKLIFLAIALTNCVLSQVELSSTPSDSRSNLRMHPLQPNAPLPAQPTPDLATLRAANTNTSNTTRTIIRPQTTTVIATSNMTNNGNLTNTTSTANMTLPGNLTNITIIPIQAVIAIANLTNSTGISSSIFSTIPQGFFVDKNGGNITKEYLILKSKDNEYISCNSNGNVIVTKGKIVQDNFWIPTKGNSEFITLRSFWGGYLGLSNNTNNKSELDCIVKEPSTNNNFIVNKVDPADRNQNNTAISFKTSKDGYLGLVNSTVVRIDNLNESAHFYPTH